MPEFLADDAEYADGCRVPLHSVKAGDGAVVLIGGEPGNREIAPRAAAHRVAEARRIVANQSSRSNGGLTTFDCL